MHLTPSKLESLGACSEQAAKFKALFPSGVKVTKKLCAKHALDFDWDWAASKLLPASALRAHIEAIAPAWRAYIEAIAPALQAYEEARAPAWRAYIEAIAPAERAYIEARAEIFGSLAEKEE